MRDFVEETPQSPGVTEPSEQELLQMLEAREQQQASGWKHLNKTFTKLVLIGLASAAVVIMAVPATRDVVVSLVREVPKALSEPVAAPVPLNAPSTPPDQAMIDRAAAIAGKANGGNGLDKHDVEFGMELLNFMQTPPHPQAQAPAATPATPPVPAPSPAAGNAEGK